MHGGQIPAGALRARGGGSSGGVQGWGILAPSPLREKATARPGRVGQRRTHIWCVPLAPPGPDLFASVRDTDGAVSSTKTPGRGLSRLVLGQKYAAFLS